MNKTTANKGFAMIGRNCKVQRQFFGSTFMQIEDFALRLPHHRKEPKRWR